RCRADTSVRPYQLATFAAAFGAISIKPKSPARLERQIKEGRGPRRAPLRLLVTGHWSLVTGHYLSVTSTGIVPVPLGRSPNALPITAPIAAILSVTFMA